MLWANIGVATAMVIATVLIHFAGLAVLIAVFQRQYMRRGKRPGVVRQMVSVVALVLGLFALHTIEIWMYAAVYAGLGLTDTFETALYFSTSTFTTVGYGDVVLNEDWRLLSAIEAANGFILIGWSTAYLVTVTGMIRAIDSTLETIVSRPADKTSDE